jgi:hypothetical protein
MEHSALEEKECIVGYYTSSWGHIATLNKFHEMSMSYPYLLLEAQFRDLEPPELCKKVRNQLPDLDWLANMILWFTSLSYEEQDIINSYINYGYEDMNISLRSNPRAYAPMNEIIAKAIPLPNDIIVYRYMEKEYLPEYGTFIHNGYLSVAYIATGIFRASCGKWSSRNILRLIVPKGTQCIYIPSAEHELIFPHGSLLQIESKEQRTIICDDRDSRSKTVTFYNALLLSNGDSLNGSD